MGIAAAAANPHSAMLARNARIGLIVTRYATPISGARELAHRTIRIEREDDKTYRAGFQRKAKPIPGLLLTRNCQSRRSCPLARVPKAQIGNKVSLEFDFMLSLVCRLVLAQFAVR